MHTGAVEGRELFISFVTVAELRYGARLAGWGEQRLRRLEAQLGAADVVWAGADLIETYVSLRHECTNGTATRAAAAASRTRS